MRVEEIRLYHILPIETIDSVISDGYLYCDETMRQRQNLSPKIGIANIKERRLHSQLASQPGLTVGQCVPFYFCMRSVMLFLLHKRNHPDLPYRGGQEAIVHLELNLMEVIEWANENDSRWAFTLSNAGSSYFEDRSALVDLRELNWAAVHATDWTDPDIKASKQAEFLVESSVPWQLVRRIGTSNAIYADKVSRIAANPHIGLMFLHNHLGIIKLRLT